jgi:hypothetical protein
MCLVHPTSSARVLGSNWRVGRLLFSRFGPLLVSCTRILFRTLPLQRFLNQPQVQVFWNFISAIVLSSEPNTWSHACDINTLAYNLRAIYFLARNHLVACNVSPWLALRAAEAHIAEHWKWYMKLLIAKFVSTVFPILIAITAVLSESLSSTSFSMCL